MYARREGHWQRDGEGMQERFYVRFEIWDVIYKIHG